MPRQETAPVAVVVAAHNAADTIDQTLGSVAVQSISPAEVVVVDDASADDTAAVAGCWADRLPLQVVATEGNVGPGLARHRGIEATASPLIAFVDADDVWFPDHLETLVGLHAARGGIALARLLRWAPGEAVGAARADVADLPPPDRQLKELYQGNFASIATLFERSLYQVAGGFRAGIRVGEEWDLYIRMVRSGGRFHRAGHPTMLYRRKPGSLTWDDRGIGDRLRVLQLARQEASRPGELRVIDAALRRLRAEEALLRAYRLALEGRSSAARRAALGALAGRRRVALRAGAMVVAPRWVGLRRQRARNRAAVRVRR